MITQCLKEAILVSSLYLCQFNLDIYETLNLSFSATNQLSKLVYLQFGVTTKCLIESILVTSLYLCQFNLDLYETRVTLDDPRVTQDDPA